MAKNVNPKYDYNIYRISINKKDEFTDYILRKDFEEIPLKESFISSFENMKVSFYYCEKKILKA